MAYCCRRETVEKFIEKLRKEIEEEKHYIEETLALVTSEDYKNFPEETIKELKLNLLRYDFVETVWCDPNFYNGELVNGVPAISTELLELLLIRDISTARDLMESIHFTSGFMYDKEFNSNILSVFEYGLLKDQVKNS